MLLLNMSQNYFAMTEFLESYYWATDNDNDLGNLLSSLSLWRSDDNTLFDPSISEEWTAYFNSVSVEAHSPLEGLQTLKQMTNFYLYDIASVTEFSRNLTYAIREICDMSESERLREPVWLNWMAAVEWILNPNVIEVHESPFKDDKKVYDRELVGFPTVKGLPTPRPVMPTTTKSEQITRLKSQLIMLDFLKYYDVLDDGNQDIQATFDEFTTDQNTASGWDWNRYFEDVAGKAKSVDAFQALQVACQYIQVDFPDNATHTDFARKLNRDVWNTIYMPAEERQQTEIWYNWMASVKRVMYTE